MASKLGTLLLLTSIHVSAITYSQKISLSVHNAPMQMVLKEIEKQSGYLFFFTDEMLQKAKPVNVELSNTGLPEALDRCFANQPLTYTISNKTIIIKMRPPSPPAVPPGMVYGLVLDSLGHPLAGASVYNRRSKQGTSTDKEGRFTLPASEGDMLEITMIGYGGHRLIVSDPNAAITITLRQAVSSLSDYVIIGYGSVQKRDVTGSLAVVTSKQIENIPFVSVDNALAGKVPGVEVIKSDGTPGGAVRIRIRGSSSILGGNTPLFVIDGVPVETTPNYINPGFDLTNPLANAINASQSGISAGMSSGFTNGLNSLSGLNVDDIESITILKDASSTAIYGSKAANGVVLITTKRGKKDMKPQINLSYYGTGSTPINPKVLNKSQYESLLTEAAQNDANYYTSVGRALPGNVKSILNNPAGFFGSANTNWIKTVTRNTYSDNAQIAVQGGGAASKYYTSISYSHIPGVVLGTDYQRVAGKINLENEIGSHFRFITNVDMGYTNQNITNGAYGQALVARPDYSPYTASGSFTSFAPVGASYLGFQNPLALTTALNNSKTLTLLGSLTAQYDFTKALSLKSTASLNMQTYNQRLYTPSYVQIGSFYGSVNSNGGVGSNANSNFNDWFWENTLSYTKQFNEKHSVDLLAGTSYETTKLSFFSATGQGYPNDNILNSLSSAGTPLYVRGDDPTKPQSYLLSFYLRANYAFMDKYLLTFTGRADGSSKFGPDNKFGYFPSGALAWRISKEKFLKDVRFIDDLKLRGSYGLTGNQNIGNQMYRTLYTPYTYRGNNALVPTQLGNAAIKWETTKSTDAGLDFSFFKGRLQGTADYYNKQTNNALLNLPVAPSTSYTQLLENVVSLRNWGYELSLNGFLVNSRDFKWQAGVNITWNKSLVTKLDKKADLSQIGSYSRLEVGNTTLIEGKPLGLITGMQVTGIIKTQKQLADYKAKLGSLAFAFPALNIGDPMFLLDTVTYASFGAQYPYFNAIIANAAPSYFGGFTQEFSYKNFDLDLYFTFSEGGKLFWGEDGNSMAFTGTSNAGVSMLGRWTPSNPNATRPRLVLNDGIIYASNLNVYNASYVKLRTVTLNYRFNSSSWFQGKGFRSASIFASATNVFTITKYPGPNPEVSDDAYSTGGGYFDVSNFPPLRTFSLGIKAGF
ncbi:SusC/RagA family TonB-linked outer membrane protein [Puia dinghuensis]|uniref:SusC/RagA family TonB-linked outer membrane protein n=1 Tax=Puia dinghuensis TaxID=1792502 RepID=UPI0016672ECF|nr:SusC/RagA family TonB-linked outer membrane protein [Puia dinghuensis]